MQEIRNLEMYGVCCYGVLFWFYLFVCLFILTMKFALPQRGNSSQGKSEDEDSTQQARCVQVGEEDVRGRVNTLDEGDVL